MRFVTMLFLLGGVILLSACGSAAKKGNHCQSQGDLIHGIHYIDEGEGQVVVLIHGAASNLNEFHASDLIEKLKNKYRVIALDRPGLGFSQRQFSSDVNAIAGQVEQIHGFLQQLDVKRPIFVGHSMGGAIAAGYLATYPDDSGGFISLAGAVSPVGSGSVWYTRAATTPFIGWIFRNALIPLFGPGRVSASVEKNFSPNRVPENYIERACVGMLFEPTIFKNNSEDLNQVYAYHKSIYDRYERIKVPVSLIYGANDSTIAARAHMEKFAQKVPQSKSFWLKDVGHLPHYPHQKLVLEEIDRIAREISPDAKN